MTQQVKVPPLQGWTNEYNSFSINELNGSSLNQIQSYSTNIIQVINTIGCNTCPTTELNFIKGNFLGDGKEEFIVLYNGGENASFLEYVNNNYVKLDMYTSSDPPIPPTFIMPLNIDLTNSYVLSGNFLGNGKTQLLVLSYNIIELSEDNYANYVNNIYLLDLNRDVSNNVIATNVLPIQIPNNIFYSLDYYFQGNFTSRYKESLILSHQPYEQSGNYTDYAQCLEFFYNAQTKTYSYTTGYENNNTDMFQLNASANIFIGDFNGDGLADLLINDQTIIGADENGWIIRYSNGQSFDDAPGVCPDLGAFDFINNPIILADYNGDGKTDILQLNPDPFLNNVDIYIYYSNGNSFELGDNGNFFQTNISSNINLNSIPFFDVVTSNQEACQSFQQTFQPSVYGIADIDINGDGKSDIILADANTFAIYSFHPYEPDNIITSITNGLNATTKISYDYLTDIFSSSLYNVGSGDTYPVEDIQTPMRVVSSVITDDGVDDIGFTTNYQYQGAKVHVLGKGFLGFDQIKSSNLNNIITKKYSILSNDYTNLNNYISVALNEMDVQDGSGNNISQTTFTNGVNAFWE